MFTGRVGVFEAVRCTYIDSILHMQENLKCVICHVKMYRDCCLL